MGITEWETALHHAAGKGDLDLVRAPIELGADPDIRDTRFGRTPLGWARHFGQEQTARFLEAITAPDPAGRHDRNRLTTIPPLRSMRTSCVVPLLLLR